MKLAKFLMVLAALLVAVMLGAFLVQLRDVGSPVAQAQQGTAASPAAPGTLGFADIAAKVNPAVVSITAISVVQSRSFHQRDDDFVDPFEFFFGHPSPHGQRDRKQAQQTGGSGFIISLDGYVLTNYHVVEGADKITVTLDDDRDYEAILVGSDEETDVALLKVDGSDLPTVPMGDSDALRPGDWVVAIGNPLVYKHTVTVGVISAKGRRLSSSSLEDFLQTDAAINFGNSGGPLVNIRGEVVGINTAITRYDPMGRAVEGIGFAIPVNMVKDMLDALKKDGRVARGYLGVTVSALDDDALHYFKQEFGTEISGGAQVQTVGAGTPAEEAGMEPGDVIISLNDAPVTDSKSLVHQVSKYSPGTKISLKILRNGKRNTLRVTLADRGKSLKDGTLRSGGEERADPETLARLGFEVQDISPRMRMRYGISQSVEGVLILSVEPTSNAYAKGVREGLILSEINGQTIRSVDDFRRTARKIESGDFVKILLLSGQGEGGYRFFRAD